MLHEKLLDMRLSELKTGESATILKVLGHGNVRGIDLDYYNPELPEVQADAAKIRKPGVFTFVFVGRLVGDKGINELVEAFERLNTEYPETRLRRCGTLRSKRFRATTR